MVRLIPEVTDDCGQARNQNKITGRIHSKGQQNFLPESGQLIRGRGNRNFALRNVFSGRLNCRVTVHEKF
jgi:hypothetical protein